MSNEQPVGEMMKTMVQMVSELKKVCEMQRTQKQPNAEEEAAAQKSTAAPKEKVNKPKRKFSCFGCGAEDHMAKQCPAMCMLCNWIGHDSDHCTPRMRREGEARARQEVSDMQSEASGNGQWGAGPQTPQPSQ